MVWKPEEDMSLAAEIAARVDALRRAKGETIKELHRTTGINYYTLVEWLNGRRTLNQANLAKLAEHFDVSLDYLYGRTDQMRGTILFRKIQALSPEDLERVNAMIDIMRHDYAVGNEDNEAPSEPVDLRKRRRISRRPEKKGQDLGEQPS